MKSNDVILALRKRWPDTKYITIPEAPLDSGRQGTKIDLLVIALWRSEGLALDAVEVKVDYQDWKREIQKVRWVCTFPDGWSTNAHTKRESVDRYDPQHDVYYFGASHGLHIHRDVRAHGGWPTIERTVIEDFGKSAAWRDYAHRFWVAAPMELAKRIKDEAPEGWGVLGVREDLTCVALTKPTKNVPKQMQWHHSVGLMRASADAGVAALQRAYTSGYHHAETGKPFSPPLR